MSNPVPFGTGMLVLTTHAAGIYYYAVTAVAGGVEDNSVDGGNSIGPIDESIMDPAPVLIWQGTSSMGTVGSKDHRIYLMYMDIEQSNISCLNMYAWPYIVIVPGNYGSTSNRMDMVVRFFGYPGWASAHSGSGNGISVHVHEMGFWGFGYSKTYQYDSSEVMWYGSSSPVPNSGPVVNYVEGRTMDFLKWMITVEPYYGNRIDTNRIWATGESMGGSATILWLTNYPHFFAYGRATVPPTNFLETDWHWLTNCEGKWGARNDSTMKVAFTGWKSEWLTGNFAGMTVHAFLNKEQMLFSMEGVDLPWFCFCSGGQDPSVTYPNEGRMFYNNLDSSRHGFNGTVVGNGGHGCSITHPQLETIRKNNSFPAFSKVSGNAVLPPPEVPAAINYTYNNHLIWSTPYYRVGGYQNQVDQLNRYEIAVASLAGDNTADITPRRLQNFTAIPGERYYAYNTAVNDTTNIYQYDTLTADAYGLITFKGFQIRSGDQSSGGSRLIIVPESPVTPKEAARMKDKKDDIVSISPNPFNPVTRILFKKQGRKSAVEIYNVRGVLVETLLSCAMYQDKDVFAWDAHNFPSGIYIARTVVDNRVLSKRITLLK